MRFERMDDGTGFYGDICWNWKNVIENRFRFQLTNVDRLSVEEVYQLFGVCTALEISPEKSSLFGTLEPLYEFLYGHPIETFLIDDQKNSPVSAYLFTQKPQKWTQSMVESIDWELFCLSYYTFLYSKSDFRSQIWDAIESILLVLQENPALLTYILTKYGRNSDLSDRDFWETIYDSLYKKVIYQLDEKRCYNDFRCLKRAEAILPAFMYQTLERECCEFFDEIARERIQRAFYEKSYTVGELVNFNIEKLFFYEEYFALPSSCAETKEYVLNFVYTFLFLFAYKMLATNDLIGADDVFTAALKYAQTDSEKQDIIQKRSEIAQAVNEARMAEARRQAVAELEWKKEHKKQNRKDKAEEFFVKFLVAVFLISIPTTILFGILTLVGVFSFSKIVFLVSGIIMLLFILALLIQEIKDRHR